MKTIYTTEVAAEGGRTGKVESANGAFTQKLDRPTKENPKAVTPEHLFGGAYAACFLGAVEAAAEKANAKLTGARVIAAVSLKEDDQGGWRIGVELRAALPGVSSDQARQILRQAHQSCPYSKALRGDADVEVITD